MNSSAQKIRMGMVGGGKGAFIGAIHRIAANLDGEIELVCGAFSSDPDNSVESGRLLYLPAERCYPDYQSMISAESQLPVEQRMDFVVIVTPNHLHFPVAKMALENGFHVLSDKPATLDLNQALELADVVKATGLLYGLTHTYTGYPLIKQAKDMVANRQLGKIRKVVVEYSQGWLASKQDESSKQAAWRLDSSQSGVSCCMGDIGVHAANLVEYVSGLKITSLCADLNTIVDGRTLDDDGTVLLRFDNDAKGVLLASQISTGEENDLRLRVYGETASLDWSQMEPNSLLFKRNNQPAQLIRTGVGELCDAAKKATRTPPGHPEGYLEAFANIYQNFAKQITAFNAGVDTDLTEFDVSGIESAVRGMAFIESAVHASQTETKWHPFKVDDR